MFVDIKCCHDQIQPSEITCAIVCHIEMTRQLICHSAGLELGTNVCQVPHASAASLLATSLGFSDDCQVNDTGSAALKGPR